MIALTATVLTAATAIGSIIVTQISNLRLQQDRHRHERLLRLFDRQEDLCLELAKYVRHLEEQLPAIADEEGYMSMPARIDDLANKLILDAKVQVFAPDGLKHAWAEFRKAEDEMDWGLEEPDGYGRTGQPYLSWDGPLLSQVRTTSAVVQESLRQVMLKGATKKAPSSLRSYWSRLWSVFGIPR